MLKFLWLFSEMMLSPRSIARASAVKMELSFGRDFLIIDLFVHVVLSLFLKLSVKMIGIVFPDIVEFILVSAGMVFFGGGER